MSTFSVTAGQEPSQPRSAMTAAIHSAFWPIVCDAMLKNGESACRSKMTSLQVITHGHGTPVVHGCVAGWTVQPAGYETDTPEADVKVPVSGANGEAGGLELAATPIDGRAEADGGEETAGDGDGV